MSSCVKIRNISITTCYKCHGGMEINYLPRQMRVRNVGITRVQALYVFFHMHTYICTYKLSFSQQVVKVKLFRKKIFFNYKKYKANKRKDARRCQFFITKIFFYSFLTKNQ